MDFNTLAQECATTVAPQTMSAIVSIESNFNALAIGVVGGFLPRQPASLPEAIATAKSLSAVGWNYSIGLAQVNVHNLDRYGITLEQAFEPCVNLNVGAQILTECFVRHADSVTDPQQALRDAFSCYYSGNYTRGYLVDSSGTSYVERVLSRIK